MATEYIKKVDCTFCNKLNCADADLYQLWIMNKLRKDDSLHDSRSPNWSICESCFNLAKKYKDDPTCNLDYAHQVLKVLKDIPELSKGRQDKLYRDTICKIVNISHRIRDNVMDYNLSSTKTILEVIKNLFK